MAREGVAGLRQCSAVETGDITRAEIEHLSVATKMYCSKRGKRSHLLIRQKDLGGAPVRPEVIFVECYSRFRRHEPESDLGSINR